jgi:hypothetical protein
VIIQQKLLVPTTFFGDFEDDYFEKLDKLDAYLEVTGNKEDLETNDGINPDRIYPSVFK